MKSNSRVMDLTGQRFGRLTVIGLHPTETRKTFWYCQCDCGNYKVVRADSLRSGAVKSCGCLKKEQDEENLVKGYGRRTNLERGYKVAGTRLYYIWQGMRGRCYDKNNKRYERYGGRGITVCDEWNKDYAVFHKWAMENGYAENLTIDRINNDGNYEPSNCRWSTSKEQSCNRTTNVLVKIGNATKALSEWCEIFELDYKMVSARYHRDNFTTWDELFSPKRGGDD